MRDVPADSETPDRKETVLFLPLTSKRNRRERRTGAGCGRTADDSDADPAQSDADGRTAHRRSLPWECIRRYRFCGEEGEYLK